MYDHAHAHSLLFYFNVCTNAMNNKTDLRCWGKLFDFRLHQLIFCTSEMNACIWWKQALTILMKQLGNNVDNLRLV